MIEVKSKFRYETIKDIVLWADVRPTKDSFRMHSDELYKIFGNRFKGKAKKTLRHELFDLLIVFDVSRKYKANEYSQSYFINRDNLNKLISVLHAFEDSVQIPKTDVVKKNVEYFKEKYKAELIGEKDFVYREKYHRRYNELVNLRREMKSLIFVDFVDYDVKSSVFSLLMNVYDGEPLEMITEYVQHSKILRTHVSSILNVDLKEAKRIITGIFNGAKLNPMSSLKLSNEQMQILRDDVKFKQFRHERAVLWKNVKSNWGNICYKFKCLPLEDKQKSFGIYFQLEQVVQNSMINFARSRDLIHFVEHDGIRLKTYENEISGLETWIKKETGLEIEIEIKK